MSKMSEDSKPLQGYIIPKKTRLQSVVVVPDKRRQSQVKRHKVEISPNAKRRPGQSRAPQQCNCRCTCITRKVQENKVQHQDQSTQTDEQNKPEVIVINRRRRRRCPKCHQRHAKDLRCLSTSSAAIEHQAVSPSRYIQMASSPEHAQSGAEQEILEENQEGYKTPSHYIEEEYKPPSHYIEMRKSSPMQQVENIIPSPGTGFDDLDEEVLWVGVSEEDRRVLLAEADDVFSDMEF